MGKEVARKGPEGITGSGKLGHQNKAERSQVLEASYLKTLLVSLTHTCTHTCTHTHWRLTEPAAEPVFLASWPLGLAEKTGLGMYHWSF